MSESAPVVAEVKNYKFTHEELAAITEARRKAMFAMELHNLAASTGASPEVVSVLNKEWRRLLDVEYELQMSFVPEGHRHAMFSMHPYERPHEAYARAVEAMKTRYEASHV